MVVLCFFHYLRLFPIILGFLICRQRKGHGMDSYSLPAGELLEENLELDNCRQYRRLTSGKFFKYARQNRSSD